MSRKRTDEVLARADLIIGDLSGSGGYLNPEQADRFIDEIQEQPTVLAEARVVRMNSHTRNIDAIGFDSRIMKAANNSDTGATGGAADDGSNDRHLAAADRSKTTQRQVQLISKEVMAEVHLHQEVLEDNIERGNLESHIMTLIVQRAALDLEEWALNADDGSGDPYLALTNGYVKLAVSNVVDNLNAGITPNMFRDAQLAMPQKYMRNVGAMRTWTTTADEIRYRSNVAARATGFGDSSLQTFAELTAFGVPIRKATQMPANTALFTLPQNLLFGIHRDIQVETERDIRARSLVVVLSTRVDCQFEDENAVVKVININ
jgi:HK97 family phage major capsid protein